MGKFAIVQIGSRQYKVREGDRIKVEKIQQEIGGNKKDKDIVLKSVLLVSNGMGKVFIGKPFVKTFSVSARILQQGKLPKVVIFKYKPKKRYRKKKGHRQPFSEIEIRGIKKTAVRSS